MWLLVTGASRKRFGGLGRGAWLLHQNVFVTKLWTLMHVEVCLKANRSNPVRGCGYDASGSLLVSVHHRCSRLPV